MGNAQGKFLSFTQILLLFSDIVIKYSYSYLLGKNIQHNQLRFKTSIGLLGIYLTVPELQTSLLNTKQNKTY